MIALQRAGVEWVPIVLDAGKGDIRSVLRGKTIVGQGGLFGIRRTVDKAIPLSAEFRQELLELGGEDEKFAIGEKDHFREERAAAMTKLGEITGLAPKELRDLYGRRLRLRSRLRLGAGETDKIEADLADVEKKLQGISERTPEYAEVLGDLDRMESVLAETSGSQPPKKPPGKAQAVAGDDYNPIRLVDDLRKIFAPANRGGAAREMGANLRENQARQHLEIQRAEARIKTFAKTMNAMSVPDRYKFIDATEHGDVDKLPADQQPIARFGRELMDRDRDTVRALGTGALEHYYENYWPRYWEQPGLMAGLVRKTFGRRPLAGSGSFLKERKYDFFMDGINDGMVPVTTNPLDFLMLKHVDMQRYITGQRIFQEMKASGLARFYRNSRDVPEGWVKIDDKIARVRQYSPTEKGFIERGDYYTPEEAARVLNNYAAPGLAGNSLYDSWRSVGNTMNALQLGMSAFHVGFTTLDVMISANALGIRQMMEGHPGMAIPSFMKGHNPGQVLWNAYQGDKLIRAALEGAADPLLREMVEALIEGGGRLKMDQIYRGTQVGSLREAIKAGQKWKSTRLAIPALIDAINKPIFEWLVPRQKLGVFMDIAAYELAKNPRMSKDDRRLVFARAWDAVDNRMGEMVYDNLFINRAFKDSLMAATRSVGWNWGSLRIAGKIPFEAKDFAFGEKTEGGKRRRAFGNNLAYAIALPYFAAMIGAITQYLYTGEGPQEIKDLYFPRTGRKRPDGSPDRVSLPTYMKDVYAWGHDPVQAAKNKAHPMVATIAEMLDNRDYFGAAIVNPDDPRFKRIEDAIMFPIKNAMPFSVRNFQQQQKQSETPLPWYDFLLSPQMVGVTPAPAYVTRSDETNEAIERKFRAPAVRKKLKQEATQ